MLKPGLQKQDTVALLGQALPLPLPAQLCLYCVEEWHAEYDACVHSLRHISVLDLYYTYSYVVFQVQAPENAHRRHGLEGCIMHDGLGVETSY